MATFAQYCKEFARHLTIDNVVTLCREQLLRLPLPGHLNDEVFRVELLKEILRWARYHRRLSPTQCVIVMQVLWSGCGSPAGSLKEATMQAREMLKRAICRLLSNILCDLDCALYITDVWFKQTLACSRGIDMRDVITNIMFGQFGLSIGCNSAGYHLGLFADNKCMRSNQVYECMRIPCNANDLDIKRRTTHALFSEFARGVLPRKMLLAQAVGEHPCFAKSVTSHLDLCDTDIDAEYQFMFEFSEFTGDAGWRGAFSRLDYLLFFLTHYLRRYLDNPTHIDELRSTIEWVIQYMAEDPQSRYFTKRTRDTLIEITKVVSMRTRSEDLLQISHAQLAKMQMDAVRGLAATRKMVTANLEAQQLSISRVFSSRNIQFLE